MPTTINAQLETGGTISGTVTGDSNNKLTNVMVNVSDSNGFSVGFATTDANGNYTLTAPAGSWRVQFNPANLGGYYLSEWYYNRTVSSDSDLVTVVLGTPTTGINAQLETGGKISGTVTNSSGFGIANVTSRSSISIMDLLIVAGPMGREFTR